MSVAITVNLQPFSGETGLIGFLRDRLTGEKLNGAGDSLVEILDENDDPTGLFLMTVSEDVSGIVLIVVYQDGALVYDDQIDLRVTPRLAGNLIEHGDRYWASLLGSGSVEYVHEVTDPDLVPLAGVQVWVTRTNDIDDAVIAGSIPTDSNGQVTFRLEPGTYYFWHYRPGFNFLDDPAVETVS
jgi:hypothetical protein